ncbi:MAG: hypothetical protein HFG47_03545 [Lachnospiraceae bacterium]|nr:hypothetical protein [Lachnospiraceae bacterium]
MKLEVTKQDKVLLSFLLAVFAAAACIFLGIIPLHRANCRLEERLALAEAGLKENQRKLTGLAELKSAGDDLQKELREASEPLYPMMESQEIDRLLTEMVLGCGLWVRKMEIGMPVGVDGEEGGKGKESYVFQVQVLLEITGSEEGKDALLDELARMPEGLKLLTMRRMKAGSFRDLEEWEEESDVMELKLELTMCGKA